MVNALEAFTHADRPGDRRAGDFQNIFYLVHQLDRIPGIPVQLVHEREDRRITQPGNLHQLDGPFLYALGTVDNHQAGVYGGQRPVSVLREVFVARGVQQVHQLATVGKLHHRGGYRDAPLLLHLHPVRLGMLAGFFTLDGTCFLESLAEQQDFLGNGGFTGVRVRDNREGAALGHFLGKVRHRNRKPEWYG